MNFNRSDLSSKELVKRPCSNISMLKETPYFLDLDAVKQAKESLPNIDFKLSLDIIVSSGLTQLGLIEKSVVSCE